MAREAVIGPEIYQEVNTFMEEHASDNDGKGAKRSEAFKAVAESRGMREAAVAANYYRLHGQKHGTKPRVKRAASTDGQAKVTRTPRKAQPLTLSSNEQVKQMQESIMGLATQVCNDLERLTAVFSAAEALSA